MNETDRMLKTWYNNKIYLEKTYQIRRKTKKKNLSWNELKSTNNIEQI